MTSFLPSIPPNDYWQGKVRVKHEKKLYTLKEHDIQCSKLKLP